MTENMMNYEVGRQLKLWRKQKNISGNLLAKRAGLSQSTISTIEHGYKSPTVQTLDKLCSAMEISLEDFFYRHFPLAQWKRTASHGRNTFRAFARGTAQAH